MVRRTCTAPPPRPGTVLPVFALTVFTLFGFIAMAIDLGLLAVARTNCQNAADAAALAGARKLNNVDGSNSNLDAATAEARAVPTGNVLFNTNFASANVTEVSFGTYQYNEAAQQFVPDFVTAPGQGQSYTATRVTVTGTKPAYFSGVFGVGDLPTKARAVAVHRPRDIAMVMDMTGSMRFGSMLKTRGFQNFLSADPSYPKFGHYQRYTQYAANSPNTSNTAGVPSARNNPFFTTTPFLRPGTNEIYAPNNYTVPTAGGPACVRDFYFASGNLGDPSDPSDPVAAPGSSEVTRHGTTMRRAFHHWEPRVDDVGDADNYVAPTYGFGGWNSAKNENGFVLFPTPYSFEDQSDANYLGDRHPRKGGKESGTGQVALTTSWNPLTADGAAVNLAEYLGWMNPITVGSQTPRPESTTNRPPVPTAAPGRRTDWRDFRDATWERFGYDLDVPHYISTRGTRDPRTAVASPRLRTRRFQGYSMGPGYWGKTFYQWPPDPRFGRETANGTDGNADPTAVSATNPVQDTSGRWIADWRRRFFVNVNNQPFRTDSDSEPTTTGTNSFDSINEVMVGKSTNSGNPLLSYNNRVRPNYRAILAWLKSTPLTLPPNLRAGRVVYYTAIPDDVDGTTVNHSFWRQYIDYVLSVPTVNLNDNNEENAWANGLETNGWPEGATTDVLVTDLLQYDPDGNGPLPPDERPAMHYLDNPNRPRSQFWFGPMSMMAFLAHGRSNAWAATVHESQTWQLKAGMSSVLDDIRTNHPNDAVGIAYFSRGGYGRVSVALGQEWQALRDALFYPQQLVDNGQAATPTIEFPAYNRSGTNISNRCGSQVPNGQGGTDPNTGLAMAFNILSPSTQAGIRGPTTLPTPYYTRTSPQAGRRGASKIVIFETDGVPNAYTSPSLQTGGGHTFYSVNTGSNAGAGNNDPEAISRALAVVNQIVRPLAEGGLSSDTSPARVYSIGFGDLFSSGSLAESQARTFLLNVQKAGRTSESTATAIPPEQIITGPAQVRIDSLTRCLERIMQSGVQVTLIE